VSRMPGAEVTPDPMASYESLTHEGAALAHGEAELRPHLSSVGVGYAPTIDFERPRYRTKRLHRALAACGASKPAIAGIDTSMLLFAVGSTVAISRNTGAQDAPNWLLAVFPLLVLLQLSLRGSYGPRLLMPLLDGIRLIITAASMSAILVIAIQALTGQPDMNSPVLRLWILSAIFLSFGRILINRIQFWTRVRGRIAMPTLILGAGVVGRQVARRLLSRPEYGLAPVGFIDSDPPAQETAHRPVPVLGGFDEVEELIDETGAGHVILAFSSFPDSTMLPVIRACDKRGIRVSLVPRLYESVNDRLMLEHLGGIPVLSLQPIDPKGWEFTAKHAFDRVAAGFLLFLLMPVLLTVALLTTLSSPGPVLFRQRRVGRDGKNFQLLKFRSMTMPPEDEQFVPTNGCAPGGVEGGDRRTFIGRLIRRLSIDELPQLINVLRGEMSLIGPRPERPEYVELFRADHDRYAARHRVKSGITGWAQVHGLRGQTSLADRIEWDNFYIENWSLWLDVKILIMTAAAVFRGD
jgi:exopolysaccharide biosynthesis polyprenyl glycosylphosphotransferase